MIFLDFDGTIVDIWSRYYTVFSKLSNVSVSLAEYKEMKLNLHKDVRIFDALKQRVPDNYFDRKKELLETDENLLLDSLIVSREDLDKLSLYDCLIVTKRRNRESFANQLKTLGVNIPYVVIDENVSKKEWIEVNFPGQTGVIIGDSIEDLEVGRLQLIDAIMVRSGLGTEQQFSKTKINCTIIDSLRDFIIYSEARS